MSATAPAPVLADILRTGAGAVADKEVLGRGAKKAVMSQVATWIITAVQHYGDISVAIGSLELPTDRIIPAGTTNVLVE